jgi:hypothetical protein
MSSRQAGSQQTTGLLIRETTNLLIQEVVASLLIREVVASLSIQIVADSPLSPQCPLSQAMEGADAGTLYYVVMWHGASGVSTWSDIWGLP